MLLSKIYPNLFDLHSKLASLVNDYLKITILVTIYSQKVTKNTILPTQRVYYT